MIFEKLVEVRSDGILEREHYGAFVVVDFDGKIIFNKGDVEKTKFFMHSSFKPFQALPIIRSGAYSEFDFNLEQLAVCSASHSGTIEHIEIVKSILAKIGLAENCLKCGTHPPLDRNARFELIRQNQEPTVFHHNCSGKHAGMLAVCVKNGWDVSNYTSFDHPLQQEIFDIFLEFCDEKIDTEKTRDGCGTPLWATSLYKSAYGALNLFFSKDGYLLKEAFSQHPLLIGGEERLDSSIIAKSNGKLIAKVGAEGFCIVINTETKQSLAIKIADGSMSAREEALSVILKEFKWLIF